MVSVGDLLIQIQLKLKLTPSKQRTLDRWLWHLTGVYNWALRKIELDAKQGIDHGPFDPAYALLGSSSKVGLPAHTITAMASQAHNAWQRCFKKLAKKPHLKGRRKPLRSIPFPDPIKAPQKNHFRLPGIGPVKFGKQGFPPGRIKCGRLLKKASGWHLCLFLDAPSAPIPRTAQGWVGIDPGFKHLPTLSTGEKLEHPRELEASMKRLGPLQRGGNRKKVARLHDKIARQRKDRNHKLSRKLVAENRLIVFCGDGHHRMAKKFGKSVGSSGHGQLRQMLRYKILRGGAHYVEVEPRNSTKTCCGCRSLTGPTGLGGLGVRQWVCDVCGASHNRNVNAAVNTLLAGLGNEPRKGRAEPYGQVRLQRPAWTTGEQVILDFAA
jgi:putative transposase